nr:hypothetical protein [Paracoccus sp. PAR01]
MPRDRRIGQGAMFVVRAAPDEREMASGDVDGFDLCGQLIVQA